MSTPFFTFSLFLFKPLIFPQFHRFDPLISLCFFYIMQQNPQKQNPNGMPSGFLFCLFCSYASVFFCACLFSSILETQSVHAASPVMFTVVRPMSKIRSIPATSAIPSTGRPTLCSTIASMIIPAPGTPAVPMDASDIHERLPTRRDSYTVRISALPVVSFFIPARLSKLKHHIESLTCIKG